MENYIGFVLVLLSVLSIVHGKYYGDDDLDQLPSLNAPIWDYRSVLDKLPQEDMSWPDESVLRILGQVAGVATCKDNTVHLFHRAQAVWDSNSFDANNVYKHQNDKAIKADTVLILDPHSGKIIKSWGKDMFYLPHGISIDPQGDVWVTDVALHQVFRFKRDQYDKPDLVLGEKFVPGNDEKHFCKPTDIAISSSGIVYISDGYCNSRVMVFSPNGTFLGKIGASDKMSIPHSLSLLEDEDLLCVADRENQRILCYTAGLRQGVNAGKLVFNVQYSTLGRVFAIEHKGDLLMAVTGPSLNSPPSGVIIDLATERIASWQPISAKFDMPHDIALSQDGKSVYVSEISTSTPKKIYKFNF